MTEKFKDWEATTRVVYICDCDEKDIPCECDYETDGCIVRARTESEARDEVRRVYSISKCFFLSTILTIEERP